MITELLNNENQALIPICVGEDVKNQIEHWRATNVFYGVFPISGDSMTHKDNLKSIPHNSKVLAYDLQIDCSKSLELTWHQIPIGQTLLIAGTAPNGNDFFVCKSISFVNAVHNNITLHSYNPEFKDQQIPFRGVNKIFKVIQKL